jgi:hypothetical protein
MNIPNPKATYGQKVKALNYRFKPSQWIEGECRGVQYMSGFGGKFYWQYDVYIRVGKGYFIYVGDTGIEVIA